MRVLNLYPKAISKYNSRLSAKKPCKCRKFITTISILLLALMLLVFKGEGQAKREQFRACQGSGCGYWSDFNASQEKTIKVEKFPPPPRVPLRRPPMPSKAKFDLNGTWEYRLKRGQLYVRFEIIQAGDFISGITTEAFLWEPETPYLTGEATSADTYSVRIRGLEEKNQVAVNLADLKVPDPDNLIVTHPNGVSYTLQRVSKVPFRDIACDPRNLAQVTAQAALRRGYFFANARDQDTSNCWLYISAVLGSARAQALYGEQLRTGDRITKDSKQGVFWLQKAAMAGDSYAGTCLEMTFNDGSGLPRSRFRTKYWLARSQATAPDVVHSNAVNPIPEWAKETSGPCDPANPQNIDAEQALHFGFVAYRAAALATAACWFQISSDEGGSKAKTYLSLSYMFGLGVAVNHEKAIDLMTKAVQANEPFAFAYLEQFYRHGIGIAANHDNASELYMAIKYCTICKSHARENAYDRVVQSTNENYYDDKERRKEEAVHDCDVKALSESERRRCKSEPGELAILGNSIIDSRHDIEDTSLGSIYELNPEFNP